MATSSGAVRPSVSGNISFGAWPARVNMCGSARSSTPRILE